MTTIKLNHEGVDVVEVKASATGTNEIHFTTKSPIFNADLAYVFCVTDLNVDTSSLPIFPPDTASILFKIKKRHLTAAITPAASCRLENVFAVPETSARKEPVSKYLRPSGKSCNCCGVPAGSSTSTKVPLFAAVK